ncbi:MAG: Gfo/Idh/MocA family oxidoreductase [Chitinophagales bacterium]|nr:Gfo/Idh/MocA family oxidoreductase [Chitinophagales bacterium]
MFKVALIGYGYWGVNLLRNLINSASVSKVNVCDIRNERLQLAKKSYPSIHTSSDIYSILKNTDIDVVVIATPTSTHYELTKRALSHNKHVLVEKPICTRSTEARELYSLAQTKGKILFTDLTFLYNGAVEYIHDYIHDEKIGEIKYIDSTRVNLGIYQEDTNVVWDLAPHDISIIQKILKQKPIQLRAISNPLKSLKDIDFVYIFLYYTNGLVVQINCSWASPTKIRQMIIGGERKMIIYDEVEPTQKIKIYNYSSEQKDRDTTLIDYRLGDIVIPKFSTKEPLQKMLEVFFSCIKENKYLCISPEQSIEIISIIENIEKSLFLKGELVNL